MVELGRRIKPCTSKGCWLPPEIMVEIMKRLPTAASIGRSRCVSKSCYFLLSDPNFIRQNTRLFDDHDDDKKARLMIICDSASSAVSLSYDTLQSVSPVLKLRYLIPEIKLGLEVGGCCDGIFCLYRGDSASKIILWNPTISDYRVLPPLSPLLIFVMKIGFGYDPLTNDYKVVAIVEFDRGSNIGRLQADQPLSVYLYSLRNDSWKALPEVRDAFIRVEVFQSRYSSAKIERCYWLCYPNDGQEWSITSFDFSKHVFNTVVLPPLPMYSDGLSRDTMSMSQDYLVTVTFKPSEKTSYVWSLNYDLLERGGGGDWIKLYTVVNSTIMHEPSSYVPAGIWEHGKCFVMDSEGRLHVVDQVSGGHGTLQIKGESLSFCEIRAYIPSPMSLSSRRWANEVFFQSKTDLSSSSTIKDRKHKQIK